MPNVPAELPEWLRRMPFRDIRFGPGVVGKTSYAILALIAVWLLIAWRMSPDLVQSGGLILVGSIITGVVVLWINTTQKFAERNPAQAVLEGAQFVDYKKFEAQAKGQGKIIEGIAIEKPRPVAELPNARNNVDE